MQLIIFGGGRWAHEIYKEANKLSFLKKIIIITKNYDFKIDNHNKKIIFLKNFSKKIINKKTKIIIANKSEKHANVLKKISYIKNHILIEKPLFTKLDDLKYTVSKKNIFFSRIWSFDKYLLSFANLIQNHQIKKISIYWHDPLKEKRFDQIKKHNLNFKYSLDIFSHLLNIIEIITKQRIKKIDEFFIKKNNINESLFSFNFNKIKCNFIISRIKKKRKRYIKLVDLKKKVHVLDFSSNTKISKPKKIKNIINYNYKNSENLKKMIKCFLLETNHKKLDINYGIKYLKLYYKFLK